ncbi:ABC transporter permease [Amorphus orientalis]|uniref:NitT/TauT family transport system permease protein n=1 Tax=Amorphus orientalis TaxID=649198 RepID=A0AAE3VNN2_9HYPH|nr:ABC transporter permease [Amorphus orientalis]MDQ0315398.1 NitT/TauT family transport system permease protein [Amorphus orientalis]
MPSSSVSSTDTAPKGVSEPTPLRPVADNSERRPVPFRGGGFAPKPIWWIAPLVFAALVLVWEIGSDRGYISQLVLPAPSQVFEAFRDLFESGMLYNHLKASLTRLVIGFTCGATLGVVMGVLIGLYSLPRSAFRPMVAAIFPIPKIALLPLFIIWFGIGEGSKVATILFGSFFPMVIATYGGIDAVDRSLIRMGQSFNMSRAAIIRKIVLPSALPAILNGMRIAASISIILLVAAEMIGAEYGIGAYVLLAGNLMATDQLIAGVIVLSVLGLIVSWLISMAERHFLRWRA